MDRPSSNSYRAVIEQVLDIGTAHQPLYRYSIRSAQSGEVIYEGHAADAADADATARAHIEYLQQLIAA